MKKTETDNPQGEPRDGQLKPVATPPVDNLTPAQRSLHQKFLQSVHSLRVGIVNTVYYLAAIHKHGIHRLLGHRRISDYAARYAGLSARQTKDFLHLARKLPDLPRIAEALDRGDLSWSQARELCGHVSVAKQTHWVELARALSRADLRELRRQETAGITRQSGCAVGSGQDEPVGPTRQIVQSPSGRAGSTSVETDRRQASGRRPQPSGPPPQHRALVTDERLRELKSAATNEKPHYVPLRFDAEQLARWDALLEFHQRREPGRSRAEIVLERLANHDRAPGTTPGRDVIAANHPHQHR